MLPQPPVLYGGTIEDRKPLAERHEGNVSQAISVSISNITAKYDYLIQQPYINRRVTYLLD